MKFKKLVAKYNLTINRRSEKYQINTLKPIIRLNKLLLKSPKINKQLAKAGYKYLKIGRDGLEKIYTTIYKEEEYEALEHGIGYGLLFIFDYFN